MSDLLMDLCWMQVLTGGSEVLESNIPASQALARLQSTQREAQAGMYGAGAVMFLRPSGERAEIETLRHVLTAAYHALQSYARGNAAPDLAEEVARAIEETLK